MVKGLPLPPIEDKGLTDFAQAMPKKYRVAGDAVQAYRNFYRGEKIVFASWTKRSAPPWFTQEVKVD